MIFFLAIFLLLCGLTLIESLNSRLLPPSAAIFIFFILFIFAALRPPEAVRDYSVYVSFFDVFDTPSAYYINYSTWAVFEPFYYLIPSVLKYSFGINNYADITIYLYAFIGCGVIMLAIRRLTAFFYASLLTLFCSYYLLHEMTQIRTAVAVGFFLFAVYYKQQHNIIKFSLCVVFSFMFHYSSLIAIIVLFFSDTKLNKGVYAALTLSALILSFLNIDILLGLLNFDSEALAPKQNIYITAILDEKLNKRSILYMLMLINTLFVIFYSEKIFIYNKYVYLLAKLQVTGLLLFQILSSSPVIASRVSGYLLTTHIILYSSLLYLFRSRFYPAVFICLLNGGILFYYLFINKLIDLKYYGF